MLKMCGGAELRRTPWYTGAVSGVSHYTTHSEAVALIQNKTQTLSETNKSHAHEETEEKMPDEYEFAYSEGVYDSDDDITNNSTDVFFVQRYFIINTVCFRQYGDNQFHIYTDCFRQFGDRNFIEVNCFMQFGDHISGCFRQSAGPISRHARSKFSCSKSARSISGNFGCEFNCRKQCGHRCC
jgi:hypothetical protein